MRGVRAGLSGPFFPLVLLLTTTLAAGLSGGSGAAAREAAGNALLSKVNVGATAAGTCHRVDEVNVGLFPRQQIIGYDYKGGEAAKLSRAMDELSDVGGSPDPAYIRVILILATYEAIAFEFGNDGCHITTVDLEIEQMVQAFERAGMAPPFGTTWSRMTDRVVWGLNP
jgi:hypothetical protein